MTDFLSRFFAWRWVKRVLVAVMALLIVVVAPLAFILYPTLKPYPETDFPPASSQAEKNLQDIAHLRRLPEIERSFTEETRTAFLNALDAMEQRAADLDKASMAMGAAKAVAIADNGHTSVTGLVGGYAFNAVPFRVGWFADGLIVIAAAAGHADLPGAQILAVNGRPVEEVVAELRPYVGGPPNLAKEFSPNFLISPELLHAAGLAESPDESEFEIRYKNGQSGSVTFAALPAAQAQLRESFWPKRHLSPLAEENRGLLHVLEGTVLPPYLSRPDDNYWHSYPAPDTVYVQINRMRDKGPVSTADYLSGLVDEAEQKKVRNAIVDLRFNRGGDYLLAADFSQRLPDILPPDGKVFILTGANTFSAAISTAARLKYFAGSRAVLIGEPVGDRGNFWGEGGVTLLPNSKIAIRYTTAFHDWENSCGLSQIRTCFFLNYFYDVPAGPLTPTVAISPTFAEYAAGGDGAMAEALRLAAGK